MLIVLLDSHNRMMLPKHLCLVDFILTLYVYMAPFLLYVSSIDKPK